LTQDVYQPNLEKRHHQLKSVHDAAPVTLNSPHRIEALFACQFIALLCCCLIERELRAAMTREQITDLPLYHEDRSCTAPTAARVFDHLAPIQRHHLTRDRHTVQTFEPQLTPLQTQLLDLLAEPDRAHGGRIRPPRRAEREPKGGATGNLRCREMTPLDSWSVQLLQRLDTP
jgi:hypothetical protein